MSSTDIECTVDDIDVGAICQDDVDNFQVGERISSIILGMIPITICMIGTIFFIYKNYILQIESKKVDEQIQFSSQEKHAKISLHDESGEINHDLLGKKKQAFPFRKPDNVIYTKGLDYFPSQESQFPILKNIELQIKYGSFVALMGGSGGGKTTLLDVLSGRRHSGEFAGQGTILGKSLTELTADDLGEIAYMRQFEEYPNAMTVSEYLYHRCKMHINMTDDKAMERAKYCIEKVKLESFANRKISALSGGQKRRVGVAKLLLHLPKVLFLDEPTSGLDALSSFEVINSLRDLVEHGDGLTILCTIHQPRIELFKLFTDVVVLCQGRQGVHANNEHVFHCYFELCANLGLKAMKKEEIGNPADAVIDALGSVTPWTKMRMWFNDQRQNKNRLFDRFRNIKERILSQKKKETNLYNKSSVKKFSWKSKKQSTRISTKFVSGKRSGRYDGGDDEMLESSHISIKGQPLVRNPQTELSTYETVNLLFAIWYKNAPFDLKQCLLIPTVVLLLLYFLVIYGMTDPCAMNVAIAYSAGCFVVNSFYMALIFQNYSQSLYDNDNLLKEKVIAPNAFMTFHFIVYSFIMILFNSLQWVISWPVYLSNSIPFENTFLLFVSRILITYTLTAFALSALNRVEDTSKSTQVQEINGQFQVIMAVFTAFNGVAFPYNLFWKCDWFFWFSPEFPGGIYLVQNIMEGQKFNCKHKFCYDHGANLTVEGLEMDKFETPWIPMLVLFAWVIAGWALAYVTLYKRCQTQLPGTREQDSEEEAIRIIGKHIDKDGNLVTADSAAPDDHNSSDEEGETDDKASSKKMLPLSVTQP